MNIIAYGSLLNKEEFFGSNPQLVIVNGYKRIFNREAERSHWIREETKNKHAVLTALPSTEHSFNAVAYTVTDEQKKNLVKREIFYHLEEADIVDFESGHSLGKAWIFVSDEKNDKGNFILKDDILPIPKYLAICREGAHQWGKKFGKQFDETTFLADGRTVKQLLHS